MIDQAVGFSMLLLASWLHLCPDTKQFSSLGCLGLFLMLLIPKQPPDSEENCVLFSPFLFFKL
jgi:hypothetical protein